MTEAASDAEPLDRIRRAAEAVRDRSDVDPEVGLILGTGLGGLAGEIRDPASVPYAELPGFPVSTVESHEGRLTLGHLEDRPIVAMEGRFHRYEGYDLGEVTFPVRVMKELGADTLVVSNACGTMHPLWDRGDAFLIADHINLMGDNPLVGPNLDAHGPRFPDMSEPYDADLRRLAREEALAMELTLREGVYVAVTGPNLETAAEYRMLRRIGADVVGMSTVPEVIVARHAGLRVLGVGIITDVALPDALEPVDVEEIIATARDAAPDLAALVRRVLARMPAADGG